jgi:hypothetical protein
MDCQPASPDVGNELCRRLLHLTTRDRLLGAVQVHILDGNVVEQSCKTEMCRCCNSQQLQAAAASGVGIGLCFLGCCPQPQRKNDRVQRMRPMKRMLRAEREEVRRGHVEKEGVSRHLVAQLTGYVPANQRTSRCGPGPVDVLVAVRVGLGCLRWVGARAPSLAPLHSVLGGQ